MITQLLLKGG